jgi:CPA1 family monovalent cation:H+ antiporter
MATSALAYASYTAAEHFHFSGAIAVVAAALTAGRAIRRSLTPHSQIAIHSFWEYAAFGVNTFLFLSIGLGTRLESLLSHLPKALLALVCVFAGRALAVYLPFLFLRRVRPVQAISVRWQHAFVLGNIKGALSIALALGLPAQTPMRDLLIDVTFGAVLVSLLAQGLTLPRALRWLGLSAEDPIATTVAEQQGLLVAARSAKRELESLHDEGFVPRAAFERLRSDYQITIAASERELRKLHEQHLAEGARLLLATRRRLMDAERTAIAAARRTGLLPASAAERLLRRIEGRMIEVEQVLSEHGGSDAAPARAEEKGGAS